MPTGQQQLFFFFFLKIKPWATLPCRLTLTTTPRLLLHCKQLETVRKFPEPQQHVKRPRARTSSEGLQNLSVMQALPQFEAQLSEFADFIMEWS